MQAIRVILFGFSSAISTLCNICRFFKQIMTLWIVWKCKRSFNSFFTNCWEALMCFEKTASVLEHFYSCTCCNLKLSISNLYCYWRAVKKYLAPFWFFQVFCEKVTGSANLCSKNWNQVIAIIGNHITVETFLTILFCIIVLNLNMEVNTFSQHWMLHWFPVMWNFIWMYVSHFKKSCRVCYLKR